jgi:hypothetical protein
VCGGFLYKKIGAKNGMWMKFRGLDAMWWLKIGSDSKLRTGLEFMWSSGVFFKVA